MAGGNGSTGVGPGAEVDAGFEFAFDNEAFSDRVLRIEVVGSDDAASRKRRREEAQGDGGEDIDSYTVMSAPVLRVETIHVCSAILAGKSNFFRKLFSNGMKESGHRQATVTIADSGHCFFLSAHGKMEPSKFLGILIEKLEDKGPVRGTIDYEIEVKARHPLKFLFLWSRTTTTDSRQALGCRIPWPANSRIFIDDKLHLRVHVKITPQPQPQP